MYEYGAYGATKRACLKQGDTGGDVERLGELLKERGHLSERDYWNAQDEFDVNIYTALRVFQAANGLDVDGVAGPNTWAKLGESGASCSPGRSYRPPAPSGPGGVPDLSVYETPFYKESWFLWTAGLGAAALILGTLLWPKKRRTGNGR